MRFFVAGVPAPQGSKRHVGGGRMVESSKALKPWREDVRQAALAAMGGSPPLEGRVAVSLWFWLRRPKSHPRSRRTFPTTRPDLDKLTRAVLDALTSAGVYGDDSQVTRLVANKNYVHFDPLAAHRTPRMFGDESQTTGVDVCIHDTRAEVW